MGKKKGVKRGKKRGKRRALKGLTRYFPHPKSGESWLLPRPPAPTPPPQSIMMDRCILLNLVLKQHELSIYEISSTTSNYNTQ